MTEQMIDSGRAALPGAATASDADLARIPVAAGDILAATAALTLAGRWDTARQLLASAQASRPGGLTARLDPRPGECCVVLEASKNNAN